MGTSLCFGVIADVQHADKDTISFDGRPQRYRESKSKLQAALSDFAGRCSPAAPPKLQFLLTLGDLVDGYTGDVDRSTADVHMIAGEFDSMLPDLPVHHVLGNHCLSATREELLKALHMPHSYYSVNLGHGWRLFVLDTTDMSLHSGHAEDSSAMQQARDWAASHPAQEHPNAHPWNGGCSAQQLAWLQEALDTATQQQEQVLVACHHPIAPGSAPEEYLAWDHDKLLQVLCRAAGTVRCVFSGHYHPGGYVQHRGIHFIVLEGVLEAPEDSNAYVIATLVGNTLKIKGEGVATSRDLEL